MPYDDGSDLGRDWSEFENSLGVYLTSHVNLTVSRLQQVLTGLTQLATSKGVDHVTVTDVDHVLSQHGIQDLPVSVTRKLLSSVTATHGHPAMSAKDFEKVMLRVSGRYLHRVAYEQ